MRLGFNMGLWGEASIWVFNLCNQLLQEFSSNRFETFHRCYKHSKDVHMTLCIRKNYFWQNYSIFDLDNIEVRFQYWVARFCNQLLLEFSSIQFKNSHRCYKHIEDIHTCDILQTKRKEFLKKWQHFRLDISDISLQYRWSVLEGPRLRRDKG